MTHGCGRRNCCVTFDWRGEHGPCDEYVEFFEDLPERVLDLVLAHDRGFLDTDDEDRPF